MSVLRFILRLGFRVLVSPFRLESLRVSHGLDGRWMEHDFFFVRAVILATEPVGILMRVAISSGYFYE